MIGLTKWIAEFHLTYPDRLIKLNHKFLRVLQDKPIKFHTDELHLAYSTLPVPKLRELQLLLFVHKAVHLPEKNYVKCSTIILNLIIHFIIIKRDQ